MDRNMTGAMIAALSQPQVHMCHLLALDLSEPVYLTDGPVAISWGGHTYMPSHFLSFSDVVEVDDMSAQTVTISLSGVDQSVIAILLLYEYLNRRARVWQAAMDEGFGVVADPNLVVSGRMDRPVIVTDPVEGTCTASVVVVGRFTPLGRRRGRFTNDSDQQLHFPGDRGMEHTIETDRTIVWGRRGHRLERGGLWHAGEADPI